MTRTELRSTLRAIAAGDVGALPPLTVRKIGWRWHGSIGPYSQYGEWADAPTLEGLLAGLLVEYLGDVATSLWLERWEPLIRAGVAIMCSVGAAKVADLLGVAVEDVRGDG